MNTNKKTSVLPLIAAAMVLFLGALVMLRSFSLDAKGSGGPLLLSGIFPHTEDYLPNPDPQLMRLQQYVRPAQREDLRSIPGVRLGDRRPGLENAPWEEVVLVAEDTHPATAATIRALAEIITGQHESFVRPWQAPRYPVVILNPLDGEVLPIGCHRMLRIASSGATPDGREDAMQVEVVVAMQELTPPTSPESAWNLWPASSVAERAVIIHHEHTAETSVAWGQRYAFTGRAIAEAALQALSDGGMMAPDVDGLSLLDMHGTWDDEIPQQPDHDVIRWYASVQAPLIRGWVGTIFGDTVIYRGRQSDAMGVFASHLARGEWQSLHEAPSDRDLKEGRWRNQRAGSLPRLWAQRGSHGWDVHALQAREDAGSVHREWLQQAHNGDTVARVQLRRHLLTPAISPEAQAAAREFLRSNDPDLIEQAMLAETEDAQDHERLLRDWARYSTGRSEHSPEEDVRSIALVLGEDPLPWDGRPQLLYADGIVVVAQMAYGQPWLTWRDAQGAVQHAYATHHLEAAPVVLQHDNDTDAWTIGVGSQRP
ncbi:MAG: hypothetical protein EA401_10060 [Planctomycetota bacterium]|nr:MAG: hypothetical protein EA401_10060 [Planctomycetota bacterium]